MPLNQSPIASTDGQRTAHWWQKSPWWAKFIALPLAGGFAGMTALLLTLRVSPLPSPSVAHPTRIDSANGTMLADWTVNGTRGEHVPLQDIPAALQQATLAVEDVKFYNHHAFNPSSMARALTVDILHGRVVEGGSTITQQLAKNMFLTPDRTLVRKLREALFAMQLELHDSKRAILEQYLNVVYYGNGAYGIGSAARTYFNKAPKDLTLAECAMLAGLPKGPSLYSPLHDFGAAKVRQRTVLDRMVQAGFLTAQEADAAYQQPLKISGPSVPQSQAPYFTAAALQEAEHRYHVTEEDLYRGNLRITTTLDPVLQQAAERAVQSTLPKDSNIQAAVVAMDPKTGAIKAMVGGRNFATSPYNRAFAERQPGSTFKAILYTAALENGWTPDKQINSEPTTFLYDNGQLYTVHDYGNVYAHRPLTMREALARSDNVYAVTTNMDVGPQRVVDTAHRMGMTSTLQPFPSLALGVCTTSPVQMATVYATLANGGYRVTPYSVSQVRDSQTGDVYDTKPSSTQVVSPQVAFQMTDLLKSVLAPNGTGYGVRQFLHGPAAAKTGTTKSDVWMVGYTPNLVTAVWVGYDDNRALTLPESHLAAPIWAKFMGTAQQRLPSDWFAPPAGLVKATIDPATAKLATDTCSTTEDDWFRPGTEPTTYCPLHAPSPPNSAVPWYRKWLQKWM